MGEDHVVLGKRGEDHAILGEKTEDHVIWGEKTEDKLVLECSFLPHGLGSRRDFAGKKRGGRTLAGGP